MPKKLFEEVHKIERAMKRVNPAASLEWRKLYYEALKYAPTPADVQAMSYLDLVEFVGQKRRFYSKPQAKGKSNNDNKYKVPEWKRKEIVEEYRDLRSKGHITNKDSWAGKYYITARTLLRWEREFPEEF